MPIPALTEKDKKDLEFALNLGVDWIALSFVQSVKDVEDAKALINGRAGVVSKLEKPLAIKALEPIVEASDAIMVARGDLGVEMDPEDVPSIQRRILNTCHRLGRPVIVATQMLESMITSPSPTRAEVSDVANAVYAGADATMLSAESASGNYPFEAVSMMHRIIKKTESDPSCVRRLEECTQLPKATVVDATCVAAKLSAEYSSSTVIALFTDSFETVVRCSRMRPLCPILLITADYVLAHKSGLCNGVYAVRWEKEFDAIKMQGIAKEVAKTKGFSNVGDRIIVLDDISDSRSVAICNV